jgi:hypothetical protein
MNGFSLPSCGSNKMKAEQRIRISKVVYRAVNALRQMDPSGKGNIVTSLELLFIMLLAIAAMVLDTSFALMSNR